MSESRQQSISKSRMDKFLFYAKFGLLVIVALLFMIGYSFYQQDLPAGTAELHIDSADDSLKSNVTILIVIDLESYYQEDTYNNMNLISAIVSNIEDLDYDLVLLNESSAGGTILDNIDKGLLLRMYNEKPYDYIIAIGDHAIIPAKEIQNLFLPNAILLTYNARNNAIFDAIAPINDSAYTQETIELAVKINPSAKKLIFIHNEENLSPSTNSIFNAANQYTETIDDLSYDTIYADHSNINEVIEHINNQPVDTVLFYVSPDLRADSSGAKHSSIIYKIQLNTDKLIYDLSPISQNEYTRLSIRYYPTENSDKPIAYIAINPEDVCEYNYEFIDFVLAHMKNSEYENTSLFVSWCMENIGFNQFPDTAQKQYDYCEENSLLIDADELQPGDLVFYSSEEYSMDAVSVAIYINDDIVLSKNQKDIICFTQTKSEGFIVSFAHPYAFLAAQQNAINVN